MVNEANGSMKKIDVGVFGSRKKKRDNIILCGEHHSWSLCFALNWDP